MGNLPVVQPSLGYDADIDVCRLNNNTGVALVAGDVVTLDTVTLGIDATTGLFSRVRVVQNNTAQALVDDRVSGTLLVTVEPTAIGGQTQFAQAGIYPVKMTAGSNQGVGTRLVASVGSQALVPSTGDVATGGLKVVGVLMSAFVFATGATQIKLVDFSGRNGHGHGGG